MPWALTDAPRPVNSPYDPYMDWALLSDGPGRRDYLPRGADGYKVPVMVRSREDLPALLKRLESLPEPEQQIWSTLKRTLANLAPRQGGRFVTFFVDPRQLEGLFGSLPGSASFNADDIFDIVTFGPPLPETGIQGEQDTAPQPTPPGGSRAQQRRQVVVGIIDDGLAFGHERFRSSIDKTRFGSVWLQDGQTGSAPAGFGYGREISATEIDNWLSNSDGDEERFYGPSRANVLDFAQPGHKPLAQRHAHGTHVLDEAFGLEIGEPHDWPIIGVQLPVRVVADSSGAFLTPYVRDAVRYIEKKARELYPGTPIVVAFSYGFTAGPHDGTHPIELGIDDVVSTHNNSYPDAEMRIVIPSGNSHLTRLHACVRFPGTTQLLPSPPKTAELRWQIQPGDTTPSFVEIWLPGRYDSSGRVSVSLTTPDGEASIDLIEGSKQVLTLRRGGLIICQVYFRADPVSQRAMFLIALQPTERLGGGPVAPAGLWTIRLKRHSFQDDLTVHAWVQRDEPPLGYPPRGRQSYFDHRDYVRFDQAGREEEDDEPGCIVQRGGSMNALATGTTPLVVGGLVRKELRPAKYSAGGPSFHGPEFRPSALVTCDDSLAHAGVIAAGTRTGSWVAMNGTSVAGPRLARWVAGEMENGRATSRAAVEGFAANEELPLPAPKPSPGRGGAGRLRLPHLGDQPRHRRFEP